MENRSWVSADPSNPSHRLLKHLLLPTGLRTLLKRLQCASTALISQHARRLAPMLRRRQQVDRSGNPTGSLALLELNSGSFTRQQIRDHQDPVIPAGQALSITIKIPAFHLNDTPGGGRDAVGVLMHLGLILHPVSLALQRRYTSSQPDREKRLQPLNSSKTVQCYERCPGSHPSGR